MGPGPDGPMGAMGAMEPHHMNGSLGGFKHSVALQIPDSWYTDTDILIYLEK